MAHVRSIIEAMACLETDRKLSSLTVDLYEASR
jgi:hypothetical protein